MEKKVLVSVKDIREEFPVSTGFAKKGVVKALDGISFDIYQGETVGLVGESGCGKSTLGRVILNLIPATSGSVTFEGHEIAGLSDSRMRPYRKDMQIIFQDPYGCLNPRQKVYDIIAALQGVKDKKELDERAETTLTEVQKTVKELLFIDTTAGVGEDVSDIMKLYQSFEKAKAALELRWLLGGSRILWSEIWFLS